MNSMSHYLAPPSSPARGGILVLHAWWGLNPFFKTLCDRFAKEGFFALAPDLFSGHVATEIKEAEKLRSRARREIVTGEILQGLDALQAIPQLKGRPIGSVGFSYGAYWSLWLAEEKPETMAATVFFYGTRSGEYPNTRSAFLGHFAETDTYVAASGVRRLEKNLKTAGKDAFFYTYPGTRHWFFENDREAYNPSAAELAWRRTLGFLQRSLG
jgi:carboxymethylenebutenolidase